MGKKNKSKKSKKQYVGVLYMSLVKMNLKWTYLCQCFPTASHHSPSSLSTLLDEHTPSRVARILWEKLVLQGSQLFPATELWLLWRGLPFVVFPGCVGRLRNVCKNHLHKHSQGKVHQYRRVWSTCFWRLAPSVSFMECEMSITFVSVKFHWPGHYLAFMALGGAKGTWWYQLLFTPSSAQRSKWCCGLSHGAEHQTCLVVITDFDLTGLFWFFSAQSYFFIWKTGFAQFRKLS